MKHLFRIITVFLLLVCLRTIAASEPAWKRVLSGQIISGPLVYENRVYTTGTDKMITCLSDSGNFLWSRPLPGKPVSLLTINREGTVYTVTENGIITAFNKDGSFLWQISGTTPPLFSPYVGWDGRFFLLYSNRLVCISPTGSIKWIIKLSNHPVLQLSETGDGDLLLYCSEQLLLRISPLGELQEKLRFTDQITALLPLSSGFAAGYESGLVQVYDIRNGRGATNTNSNDGMGPKRSDTELLWQLKQTDECLSLSIGQGTILSVHSNGSLYGFNSTDGTLLWHESVKKTIIKPVSIIYDYDQFNITFQGFAGARTIQGNPVWELLLPETVTAPVVSTFGHIFASSKDWTLLCFQAETRIKNEKIPQKTRNYGILNGKSSDYGMPFASDSQYVQEFFVEVTRELEGGTVGVNESSYARRLTEILSDNSGDPFSNRTFDATEQGRSARLLGQLGSSEYRDVLIERAYGDYDSTVAIGILYGLAAFGYDTGGETLRAIQNLIFKAGSGQNNVLCAACDALYSLIRYSGGQGALDGTEVLLDFLSDSYSKQVQAYARRMLENIIR